MRSGSPPCAAGRGRSIAIASRSTAACARVTAASSASAAPRRRRRRGGSGAAVATTHESRPVTGPLAAGSDRTDGNGGGDKDGMETRILTDEGRAAGRRARSGDRVRAIMRRRSAATGRASGRSAPISDCDERLLPHPQDRHRLAARRHAGLPRLSGLAVACRPHALQRAGAVDRDPPRTGRPLSLAGARQRRGGRLPGRYRRHLDRPAAGAGRPHRPRSRRPRHLA